MLCSLSVVLYFIFFAVASTMKDDDPTYVPGSCSRKGQPKTQDAPDLECATPELSQGYRLFTQFLNKCYSLQ